MGVTKIEIEKPLKVKQRRSIFSGSRVFRLRGNKYIYLVSGVLLTILIIGLTYFAIIPGLTIRNAANELAGVMAQFQNDLNAKTVSDFSTYLGKIDEQLNIINVEIDKFDVLKDIPATEGYYDNLQVIKQLSSKSKALLAEVSPDLDTIFESAGYKSGEVVVESETGNEVGGIIKELPRIVTLYQEREEEVLDLLSTFNKIDPDYIPSIITGGFKVKVAQIQKATADFPVLSAQLKDTLSMLPELLGAETPTKYLVIYQNEKEMRSSGGLLTAFGNLTIDKGVPGDDISSTDMLVLENYVSSYLGIDVGYRNIYGQDVLMNSFDNSCGSSYLRAQDSGIYPDLNVSIGMFKDYYDTANKYNKKQFPDYDHIVIINTFFASNIISLVEPLEVDGETITSENAAKIIFGETSSQPFDPAVRKEFIGKVATALKDKFNQLSAADFPRIVQILIKTIQAKNLAFYSENTDVQAYFDELGMSGRIEKNFAGDYFHLNEAQNCALKSNFYVYDTVTKTITINEAGDIRKDVSVEWVNEKVYDVAEEFIYSASFNYRYRAWVRLFMPQGSKVVKTDGYEKSLWLYWPVEYFDKKMQKQVSDNVIYFDHRRLFPTDPVRKHTLNVSYTLPDALRYSDTSGYRLLLQKHPGKKAERYIININDKGALTSTDFMLDRDKVLTYQNGIISVVNFDTRLDQYYNLVEAMK